MDCGEGIFQENSASVGIIMSEYDTHMLDYMPLNRLTHFYGCLVAERRRDQPLHQKILTGISILIGLFGLFMFIFDGVNLVAQRHLAQIVANQAAVAGAHAFCEDGDVSIAVYNHVASQPSIHIERWYLDHTRGEITVETGIDFNTLINKLLGGPRLYVSTSAQATCSLD